MDAVEATSGRLFLIASPMYVLTGQQSSWEVACELDSPAASAAVVALADTEGKVHVLYQGYLWPPERYWTNFPHSTGAKKLFHALWTGERWSEGVATAGPAPYNPEFLQSAAGPQGSVYAVFAMEEVEETYAGRAISLGLSVYKGGEWRGPFMLVGDPRSEECAEVKIAGAPSPGTPHLTVDKEGVCHVVWGNAYVQFGDGACTEPWLMVDDGYATAVLSDREDRLVVFLAREDRLVARVRDERGWSEPFEVAGSAKAFPILGNDGNMYLVWVEFVTDPEDWTVQHAHVCLQRIVFEEAEVSPR